MTILSILFSFLIIIITIILLIIQQMLKRSIHSEVKIKGAHMTNHSPKDKIERQVGRHHSLPIFFSQCQDMMELKLTKEQVKSLKKYTRDMELRAREMSKFVHKSENAGEKADTWICGDILLSEGAQTNCAECGKICYYDTRMKDEIAENHKKVCLECCWRYHMDDMSALLQQIINDIAKDRGWKK